MREPAKPLEGVGTRMGNRVTVGKWNGHPFYKWRANFIEGGKRKKRGFKTRRAAEDWAERRKDESLVHGTGETLTASERAAVIETREALAALGITLRAALDHSVEFYRRSKKSATVERLMAEVIERRRKAGLSKRYLQDMDSRLGRFREQFGERSVATISRDEIADWLHALNLSPVSTNNFRRLLVVAFNDAIESGFNDHNPAEKVKMVKVIEGEVGILTPQETLRLLTCADERILPVIAIGAFAGLRTSELETIEWSEVKLGEGHIRVRARSAKSSRNRLIPIPSCLSDWLRPVAKPEGRIWPVNGRKLLNDSKRRAGFGNPDSRTTEEKARGVQLSPWPENALRHSFASYHLAHHKNAGELALQMGHTDTRIIFQHYRELVTPKEASSYWSLVANENSNIIPMTKPA